MGWHAGTLIALGCLMPGVQRSAESIYSTTGSAHEITNWIYCFHSVYPACHASDCGRTGSQSHIWQSGHLALGTEPSYHVENYKLTLHFDEAKGEVFGDEVVTLRPFETPTSASSTWIALS